MQWPGAIWKIIIFFKKKAKQNTKRKAITRKRMKEKQQLEGIEDAIEIEKLERIN